MDTKKVRYSSRANSHQAEELAKDSEFDLKALNKLYVFAAQIYHQTFVHNKVSAHHQKYK